MAEQDGSQRAEKRRRRIAGQRLSGLLMCDDDELEDFRGKRLGRGTPITREQLTQLRALLEHFGEALAEPTDARWAAIEAMQRRLGDAAEEPRERVAAPEPAPLTQMSPKTDDEADALGGDTAPGLGPTPDRPSVTLPRAPSASPRSIPVSAPLPLGAPRTRGYKPRTTAPAPPTRPVLPKAPPPPRPPPSSTGQTIRDEVTADTNINVIPVMFDEDSESSIVTAITMVADPATRRPAVLPFQRQSSRQEALLAHTTATPGGMSLTGYAAFCAALAQPGVATEEVCARYGVDEDARQRLDQAWYAHFDTDPRLHQLWGQLYTTFHSLLNEHP